MLNNDSAFREAGWLARARSAASYPLNPRYALLSHMTRPDGALARWDACWRAAPCPPSRAPTRTARSRSRGSSRCEAPSYAASFGVARTHVLLDRPLSGGFAADRQALLAALAAGRAYVGLDGLADANGFSFTAEAEGRRWTMGDTVPLAAAPRLRAGGRMPAKTRLVLLRDGAVVTQVTGALDVPVEAGGHLPRRSVRAGLVSTVDHHQPHRGARRCGRGGRARPRRRRRLRRHRRPRC